MNTYGRTREDRLTAAVERMGEKVLSGKKSVQSVYAQVVGAERKNATPELTGSCVSQNLVAGVGFEPTTFGL